MTVFIGSLSGSYFAWGMADLFMSLMAILNILVIVKVSRIAVLSLNDYLKQRKGGRFIDQLRFNAQKVGITNTDFWCN